MKYTDFSISLLVQSLAGLAMKDRTPRKYMGPMFEAAEVISQLLKERDAAIQALREAEKNGAASGPWVSVEDRLPEDGEYVLVVVSGQPQPNIRLIGAYEFAEYTTKEGWILNNYPAWETAEVSHWAPLPEPPERVEQYEN